MSKANDNLIEANQRAYTEHLSGCLECSRSPENLCSEGRRLFRGDAAQTSRDVPAENGKTVDLDAEKAAAAKLGERFDDVRFNLSTLSFCCGVKVATASEKGFWENRFYVCTACLNPCELGARVKPVESRLLTAEEQITRAAIFDVIDNGTDMLIAMAGNGDESNAARLDFCTAVIARARVLKTFDLDESIKGAPLK